MKPHVYGHVPMLILHILAWSILLNTPHDICRVLPVCPANAPIGLSVGCREDWLRWWSGWLSPLTVVTAESAQNSWELSSPTGMSGSQARPGSPSSFLSVSDKLRFGSCKLLMFATVELIHSREIVKYFLKLSPLNYIYLPNVLVYFRI